MNTPKTLKRCMRCKNARFCDVACSRAGWEAHRPACDAAAAATAAAAAATTAAAAAATTQRPGSAAESQSSGLSATSSLTGEPPGGESAASDGQSGEPPVTHIFTTTLKWHPGDKTEWIKAEPALVELHDEVHEFADLALASVGRWPSEDEATTLGIAEKVAQLLRKGAAAGENKALECGYQAVAHICTSILTAGQEGLHALKRVEALVEAAGGFAPAVRALREQPKCVMLTMSVLLFLGTATRQNKMAKRRAVDAGVAEAAIAALASSDREALSVLASGMLTNCCDGGAETDRRVLASGAVAALAKAARAYPAAASLQSSAIGACGKLLGEHSPVEAEARTAVLACEGFVAHWVEMMKRHPGSSSVVSEALYALAAIAGNPNTSPAAQRKAIEAVLAAGAPDAVVGALKRTAPAAAAAADELSASSALLVLNAGCTAVRNLTFGGANAALCARFRWAGAIPAVAAALRAAPRDARVLRCAFEALAALAVGGGDDRAALDLVCAEGAGAAAVRALRGFPDEPQLLAAAAGLLLGALTHSRSGDGRAGEEHEGAVAACAEAMRRGAARPASGDWAWRETLYYSAGCLSNSAQSSPGDMARVAAAGCAHAAVEALPKHLRDAEMVKILSLVILCCAQQGGAEAVPVAAATAARLAAAKAAHASQREVERTVAAALQAVESAASGATGATAGKKKAPAAAAVAAAGRTCGACSAGSAQDGGPLKLCGRCKKVGYCSAECQKVHWRIGHKENCSK